MVTQAMLSCGFHVTTYTYTPPTVVGNTPTKENHMSETGIDWDWYDNGPGSENWKHKMAEEKRAYDTKWRAEQKQIADKAAKYDELVEGGIISVNSTTPSPN